VVFLGIGDFGASRRWLVDEWNALVGWMRQVKTKD